ncbi:hypothetical protein TW86_20755 [Halomonas sp. S2151]|nr:hypothetical protein TW86_20755 [Halomonas sp. S2151]
MRRRHPSRSSARLRPRPAIGQDAVRPPDHASRNLLSEIPPYLPDAFEMTFAHGSQMTWKTWPAP